MTTLFSYMRDQIEMLQSDLDKASARIAQLEEALAVARLVMNDYSKTIIVDDVLAQSSSAWLSDHDKAVEARVLEEAEKLCLNLPDSADTVMDCSDVLCRMIESRK